MTQAAGQLVEVKPRDATGTFIKNALSNASGMIATSLISFLLPAFLVHHLDPASYSAWVLILNLGAYVGYLDFGVQTAVSKFVAEHEAKGDLDSCGRCVSTGFVMMLGAAALGAILTLALAVAVPQLFSRMPVALFRDVQLGIVFIGLSLSFGLLSSTFQAVFTGLQRYKTPTSINLAGRALYAIVLCSSVAAHSSLAVMGAGVAAVNVCTGLAHFTAWRRKAGHIRLRPFPVDFTELRKMVSYCVVLTVWSMCMLVISGLDLTVVGHYAFTDAAFYSVAAAPTTIMLLVVGALMGPLLPAASALSATRTPEQMGKVLLRSTRLATTLYWVVALPLLLGGYIFLDLWVGAKYATAAIPMLRILLLANVVRQLCGPYAAMVIATSRQRVATAAAIGEGVVNLTASILLARRFGGVGVAAGTLIGAASSVSMHFGISMHYTRNLAISRSRLFLLGILKPAAIAIPSILLLRFWWVAGMPRMTWLMWTAWAVSTPLLAYSVALSTEDRTMLRSRFGLA